MNLRCRMAITFWILSVRSNNPSITSIIGIRDTILYYTTMNSWNSNLRALMKNNESTVYLLDNIGFEIFYRRYFVGILLTTKWNKRQRSNWSNNGLLGICRGWNNNYSYQTCVIRAQYIIMGRNFINSFYYQPISITQSTMITNSNNNVNNTKKSYLIK